MIRPQIHEVCNDWAAGRKTAQQDDEAENLAKLHVRVFLLSF